jgi:hypothetical protein
VNRRSLVLVSAPATEPVTLSDVKAFLRVDDTNDDTLIASLISSARRACEEYTKRAFITQTWSLTLDRFPCEDDWEGPYRFLAPRCDIYAIQLPRQPIQSITSIKTTDGANAQTTVAGETYTLDVSGGRALLNDGFVWPCDLRDFAAVEIITVNGYGDAAAVPEPIKQAILQYAATMYSSRQCSDLPDGCKTLLASFCAAEAFGA